MKPWRWLGWIALIAVILYCVWVVRTAAISVIIGVFITALLLPPFTWLRGKGLGRGLATTLVCVGGLILAGIFFALLVPLTVSGLGQLQASMGSALDDLHNLARSFGLNDTRLADLTEQVRAYITKQGQAIATGALAGVRTAGEIVIGAVLAVILAIYFVHGGDRLFHWLTELAPATIRGRLRETGDVIFGVVGRYIRGIAMVGLVDGFFIGLALWILGVPIALPLAVLTFIGAFLPVVGAFLAGLFAAVVAFVAKGWLVALIVVGVTILVQQLEGHVLAPQIYGRALDLPGAVILLAITVGSVVAGITGAFLAAPVASVVVALIRNREGAPAPTPAPGSA
ncbi:AI-2E family transporter [Nonomuraea sp. NBC_01738]|uniref:AI-2E family transporter n=1 Tax=Nonomuraea sp. NBC_01738 TaxID=2976003 RepID=UPI002E1076F0|nr:AI-2E family transporter [Nonomuraea sp. NBC_01738]